ncbi:MAG: ABC transporter permease subunit [Candidatus Marinimicrobia bacterium]|nr:ABC transporter permease subunit [Candidatus Neomarinimicrobiota bacterium]MCF7922489.1 ABC transporter permease subunit [Candidatus Neomarinimicrobiota bacterium]
MSEILAIYRKEMKTYFNSPIAFIVISSFLVITNWLFFDYGDYPFFAINIADIRGIFDYGAIVLLFIAPAVSMRLISEEKHQDTLELLVTMPITDMQIIIGKYLSTLVIFAIILAGTLIAPISISFVGDLDSGIVISSYIGFFFLGATYLAMGLAASSFTRNQIIAYIVGIVIIAVFFLMNGMANGSGMIATLFENLSIRFHYQNFFRGVLDTRDLIYFISLIFVSLLVSSTALASRKSK